jgi:hypothetical protein
MADDDKPLLVKRLEWAGKVTAAVTAIIYILGLVVVTLHLGRYGASGLGLLHEQYVVAGIWVLVPPVIATLLIAAAYVAAVTESQPDQKSRYPRWLSALFAVIGVVIGYPVIAGYFLSFVSGVSVGINTTDLVLIGAGATFFAVIAAAFLAGGLGMVGSTSNYYRVVGLSLIVFGIFPVVGYVGYFTKNVYPKIPASIGGGEPVRIRILLGSEKNEDVIVEAKGLPEIAKEIKIEDVRKLTLTKVKNPVQEFLSASSEYDLLFVTNDAYIVVDPSDPQRALEIKKGMVSAVRHLPSKKP